MGKLETNTVTGKISADMLGKTLIHEHFAFGYPGWQGDSGYTDKEDEALSHSIAVATEIKKSGIKTVVDATPNDCGRNPLLLKKVSEETGLNIICSSGYYYEGEGAPAYFKIRDALGGDMAGEVYDLFKREVTEGIGKTGVKAGVFKLASSKDEITAYEKAFFKAAAKVSTEENISIITHTQEGSQGIEQADLLLSEGVEPSKVLIGHCCCNTDLDYLMSIMEKGVFIGFDRFGVQGGWGAPNDDRRIACLIGLIGAGYVDNIMVSQDKVNYWLGRPVSLGPALDNWNSTHFIKDIVPELKKAAITDEQINTMLVDNPLRFFSGQK